jgi:hypothetical protein
MMKSVTKTLLLAALAASLAATGCGTETAPGPGAGTSAAVASAARHLESRDGDDREEPDDRDGDGDDDAHDQELRVSRFQTILNELRGVPALAPLFDRYGVPDPIVYDEHASELVALLRAVRLRVSEGTLTITNRETGGVIYAAPLGDLAAGTFQPEHLPGSGPTPPSTCTAFTYAAWGACRADGTQVRTVLASSPVGCTGGAPVTTQPCTYVPPSPSTCTSFTYSAWGACQADGTQARTVLSSSPTGCTGGAPATTQACTYVPPPAACGTCHSIPPATGRHAFHTSFLSCASCHGTGYSPTTVNAATHQNGTVNLAASAGYSGGSCANSCHGSRSW